MGISIIGGGGGGGTSQDETNLGITAADEGTVAGSARGAGANDLQTSRSAAREAATGSYSTICGGQNNESENTHSICGGGLDNRAGGNYGSILGGRDNFTSGQYANVTGGRNNSCDRQGSRAGGEDANTFSASSDVFGLESIDGASGECQRGVVLMNAKTTDATSTSLRGSNNAQLFYLTDTTHLFNFRLIGRKEGDTDYAVWDLTAKLAYRDGTAAITIVTAISSLAPTYSNGGGSAWRLTMSVSSTLILDFSVVGQSSTTIKWFGSYEFIELVAT